MKAFFGLLFSDPVSIVCNLIIIAAGVIVAVRLSGSRRVLEECLQKIRRTFEVKHRKYTTDSEGLPTISADTGYIDEEGVIAQKRDFEEQAAKVNSLVQLIPIFPSMGILGTVIGLMQQISAQGIDQMTGAIATALSSTLFALIVTIVLKAYVALRVSRIINEIDIEFTDNDRYHQEFIDSRKKHGGAD